MVQIPILSGIFSDNGPDLRIGYPVNMVPVALANGVSSGYLRPADGIVQTALANGVGRGGINWRDTLYRVMGDEFISVDALGNITVIGNVLDDGKPVRFTYGFTLLAIASGGRLYYYDGTTLTLVVDVDVGTVVDVVWIDGYFVVTDGEFLAVSELSDPFSFNPLKYGSSESDPDPVLAVLPLRNEVIALNRYTMEWFANVGGEGFPFQRIAGAKITKGIVGTFAACVFLETLAFVGSGRNEAPGVYIGVNATANKISTVEVDRVLASFTEEELARVVVETRNDDDHQHLYLHLLNQTLVYDAAASRALGEPVWFILSSSLSGRNTYRARFFVWCYDQWNACDPISYRLARMTKLVSTHFDEPVAWMFSTQVIYNDGRGVVVNELELVALPGRVALGVDPTISTSWSGDGVVWSQPRYIKAGKIGDRLKRLVWTRCGTARNLRMQRFAGTSDAHVSFVRLEAQIEGLAR